LKFLPQFEMAGIVHTQHLNRGTPGVAHLRAAGIDLGEMFLKLLGNPGRR